MIDLTVKRITEASQAKGEELGEASEELIASIEVGKSQEKDKGSLGGDI